MLLNTRAMPMCPATDFSSGSNADRPEAVQEAVEMFMEHGSLLIKRAFGPDYVGELHRTYVDAYRAYFVDRDFADALSVGNKRTQITVDVAGPFNSPELYANPFILPVLKH